MCLAGSVTVSSILAAPRRYQPSSVYCALAVLGGLVPRVYFPFLVPTLALFDSLPMIDPAMLFVLGT